MVQRLEIDGARYYAEPGEQVLLTVPETSGAVLGIVTKRSNGLHYASVVERKDYGEIAEWGALPRVLDRSIVGTPEDGRNLLHEVFAKHGYTLRSNR
jgi:hypothetical protein